MKQIYTLYTLVLFAIPGLASAQSGHFDFSATSPLRFSPDSYLAGGGVAIGLYSMPIEVIPPRTYKAIKKGGEAPLAIRFGGFGAANAMGYREFKHIPLLSPGQGEAHVNFQNCYVNCHLAMRITSSIGYGAVLPYVEGFAGLRYFESSYTVKPDDVSQKSAAHTLYKTCGVEGGIAGGLLIRMNEVCYLNAGVMFTRSEVNGNYLDLQSLRKVGPNVGYKERKLPYEIMVVRLGVTFNLDEMSSSSGSGSSSGGNWNWNWGGCGGGGGANIGLIKF